MNTPKKAIAVFSHSFVWSLLWRLITILALGGAATWSFQQAAMVATSSVLLALAALLFVDLLNTIRRTNQEVSRMMLALRHGDFSTTFHVGPHDAGFAELAYAMEELIASLRTDMTALSADISHLSALINQVPIPLLTIDADDQIDLINNAARRLFNRPHGRHLADFSIYGEAFVHDISNAAKLTDTTLVTTLTPADDAATQIDRKSVV